MPFLLSPAGTKDALVAAVQSGANEIYLGLSDFNARASAENFTVETLQPWVKYAHVRGVRIFVTLNTLLGDGELSRAVLLAKEADNIGVDAFIVQDVGLARKLSGNVRAALHASTQLSVYDKYGVRMLKELGFSRAVLARELPLEEIAEIVNENIMETEVFCHGALCMSYSGQCLLSFASGSGRSGNRGTCSQPCRLKYSEVGSTKFSHLLSPSDLMSLPYIKKLAETGVTSLKIEGRLKAPEYVAAVTSAYRAALDGEDEISNYIDELQTVFSRGGFCSGHQLGKLPVSAITRSYAGRTGLIVGKTAGATKELVGNVRSFRMPVVLEKPLAVGDGISFLGYPDFGGIVNKIDELGGAKKSLVVCGTAPDKYSGELTVYKTLDAQLDKKLKQYYREDANFRRVPITAEFFLSSGVATLLFKDAEGRSASAMLNVEADCGTELREADAIGIITATGNTPFVVSSCECHIENGTFIKFSELKKLRREAAEKLAKIRENRI